MWLYLLLLFPVVGFSSISTTIPANAYPLLPELKKEISIYWNTHPRPAYFGALIEHESCISLTHSRCWKPTSRLKTQREEGAGLGQITRAYNPDGSIRFDALTEMRNKHKDLRELSWSNIYTRADLQLRAIVLKSKDDYKALIGVSDPIERLYFTDVAYNQGIGRTLKQRKTCGLKQNCNPQLWFSHVEKQCVPTKVIYANRTACDISRHHVKDVFTVRLTKYKPHLE